MFCVFNMDNLNKIFIMVCAWPQKSLFWQVNDTFLNGTRNTRCHVASDFGRKHPTSQFGVPRCHWRAKAVPQRLAGALGDWRTKPVSSALKPICRASTTKCTRKSLRSILGLDVNTFGWGECFICRHKIVDLKQPINWKYRTYWIIFGFFKKYPDIAT